ncbi:hypothetical protein [Gottfriedia solisilvae]|uniref:hypothetical protein n=1 Tax=Gottfriedia solisilvae TaxID=1516104 RepID=UPI003D2F44FB
MPTITAKSAASKPTIPQPVPKKTIVKRTDIDEKFSTSNTIAGKKAGSKTQTPQPTPKQSIPADNVQISIASREAAAKQSAIQETSKAIVSQPISKPTVVESTPKQSTKVDTVSISAAAREAATKFSEENKSSRVSTLKQNDKIVVKVIPTPERGAAKSTDVKTLVNNLEQLEKTTNNFIDKMRSLVSPSNFFKYPKSVHEINQLNLEYIRSNVPKYSNDNWAIKGMWGHTAGTIDPDHTDYMEENNKKVDTFLSPNQNGAILRDPVTGRAIDTFHLFATLDGITSSPNSETLQLLSGWGGDLQTALTQLRVKADKTNNTNNTSYLKNVAENLIGNTNIKISSFSEADLLADIDAVNIACMMDEKPKMLLSDAVEKYYSKNGGVQNRFSEFIENSGGIAQIKKDAMRMAEMHVSPLIIGKPTDKQEKIIVDAFVKYIVTESKKE